MKKITALILSAVMAAGIAGAVPAVAADTTDVLTVFETEATTTTYVDWTFDETESGAVYSGNSARSSTFAIQMRSKNNSGIVTTTSGGYASKVEVDWDESATTGTLYVYGKSSAYSSASDLYQESTSGTLIGSIACGTDTELEIEDSYEYIGLRSASGAIYLQSVSITWDDGSSVPVEKCSVTFDAGAGTGSMKSVSVSKNADYTLPECSFAAPSGMRFAGWQVPGGAVRMPGQVITVTADTTLTAVWAQKTSGPEFTDNIDVELLGVGGSYDVWSGKVSSSNAVYAGKAMKGKNAIQLNGRNDIGIVTTSSGGSARRIEFFWNADCTAGTTVNIYGKDTPYESAADLYDTSKSGTAVASTLSSSGSSSVVVLDGDVSYIGIKPSNAVYIDEIRITWESDDPDQETYTVTLTPGDGQGEKTTVKVVAGHYFKLPACSFTAPEGMLFDGWKQKGTTDVCAAGTHVPVIGNTTYIASYVRAKDQFPSMPSGSSSYSTVNVNTFSDMPHGTVAYRVIKRGTNGYAIKMDAEDLNRFSFGQLNSSDLDEIIICLPQGYTLSGNTGIIHSSDGPYRLTDYNGINTPLKIVDTVIDTDYDPRDTSLACAYRVCFGGKNDISAVYNAGSRVKGMSLSLGGDIGVRLYMTLSDAAVASSNAYMEFTLPDGSRSTVTVGEAERAGGYYVFKCHVKASEMTQVIEARMVVDGHPGEVYSFTVRDYAEYILEHTEKPEYAKAEPLVRAMLNYGAYAQEYFKVPGMRANQGYEDGIMDFETCTGIVLNDCPDFSELMDGVTVTYASLSLKSETTLSLYFDSAEELEFTCSEQKIVDVSHEGNHYVVRIRGIRADELIDVFTLVISTPNDDSAGFVRYSPINYCCSVLESDSTSTPLKLVVKALYRYYQAAAAYKENTQ